MVSLTAVNFFDVLKVLDGTRNLTYDLCYDLCHARHHPDTPVRYLICLLFIVCLPATAAQNLRILLTNDDGFESPGITALHRALLDAGHDVYLIAPATQQSGASASVSAGGVKVEARPGQVWTVEGRPADAVRFGLGHVLYNQPPDLVISGANFGQNTGRDVNISGTVGAAITALQLGVPAIAVSVEIKLEEAAAGFPSTAGAFSGAARLVVRLLENLQLSTLDAVLNINYPARLPLDIRGVRWSELSEHSLLSKRYSQNAKGLWTPEFLPPKPAARSADAESLAQGFVTMGFLDGDLSVPTRRNQRYLDQYLLDRSFEPAAVKPRPSPMPAKNSRTQPDSQRTESPAASSVLSERKPENPAINLQQPVTAKTVDVGSPRSTSIEATIEATNPSGNRNEAETGAAADEPPNDTADPVKRKPDSWLRRMFNPGSWGN